MDFVSGEKIQQLCPVYCGETSDFMRNPVIACETHKHWSLEAWTESWDNPSLLFCYSNCLPVFQSKRHLLQNPYVLVSHNEDTNITEDFLPLCEDPRLQRWFAQNVCILHPKLSFLPIGLANAMWPSGGDRWISEVRSLGIPKQEDLYVYFSLYTNPSVRLLCKEALERNGILFGSQQPYPECLLTLAQHRFAICPEGNGTDCHRIWECYALGVIPIVLCSIHKQLLLAEFPCILVDSWEDVCVESYRPYLDDLYKRLMECQDKLCMPWYRSQILGAV